MSTKNSFKGEYFEGEGSLYTGGYRYIAHFSNSLARSLIWHLKLTPKDRVLDYGCAKGFLVKALREFGIWAWGMDVSKEALQEAPEEVNQFVGLPWNKDCPPAYDWIIAKDVLEHMSEKEVVEWLRIVYPRAAKGVFVSVPLADKSGKYIIPASEKDPTHQIRRTAKWWRKVFRLAGFHVQQTDVMEGVNDKWAKRYPGGQGIFVLQVPSNLPKIG